MTATSSPTASLNDVRAQYNLMNYTQQDAGASRVRMNLYERIFKNFIEANAPHIDASAKAGDCGMEII